MRQHREALRAVAAPAAGRGTSRRWPWPSRMASITIVAVIVPETVITPPCQVLTGPSLIGGTYVPWSRRCPAPARWSWSAAAMSGAPQPASAASFIDLSLRNGLATIDLLRLQPGGDGEPSRPGERYPGRIRRRARRW